MISIKGQELISVIVPIYNTDLFLERCVDSILNQTYENLEIILVNDGSTDRSGKICDNYINKDARVKVIHKKNGGASTARNTGLQAANGVYIGFVDSDDYISLNMYEEMVQNMEQDVDIVTCGTVIVSENNKISKNTYGHSLKRYRMDTEESVSELVRLNMLSFSVCDKLFRSSLIKQISFPKGRECEDLPFCYDAVKNARNIVHIGKIKYFYWNWCNSTSRRDFHPRSMDYVLFSRDIWMDVRKKYPKAEPYAFVMYIRNLVSIMCRMRECKSVDVCSDLRYLRLKKALWTMLPKILLGRKIPTILKKQVWNLVCEKNK